VECRRQAIRKRWADPNVYDGAARSVGVRHDSHGPYCGSAFGGREKGVSRVHATLYRLGHLLSIVDLASANGTYRNGLRLGSNQPRFLLDGDELCFGKMEFRIHFGD
jgi:pSer/pThr/pTyr-binding forkhead associated (FHA) protein